MSFVSVTGRLADRRPSTDPQEALVARGHSLSGNTGTRMTPVATRCAAPADALDFDGGPAVDAVERQPRLLPGRCRSMGRLQGLLQSQPCRVQGVCRLRQAYR